MKKTLLFVAALLTAATSFAQDYEEENPTWTKTITNAVAEASDVEINSPLVITNQGDVIKTGTFTESFSFAGETLEPIAKSSYIVKYDKKGNEVWVNALRGAATVTAVTTDDEGNIYVAGKFADKVLITTTNGNVFDIDGMAENNKQVSAFIVVYDKDGKLLAHRQFVPELDPALMETFMYFPEDGDVYFRINNIKVANGKVYITANYTGVNKIDEVELQGRVLNVFDFMYMDINSAAALQLDNDLTGAKLIADVQTTDAIVDMQMGLHDINLAVDGENVFVAWTGTGNLTMTTEKESKDFAFEYGSHPFVVSNVTTGQTKAFEASAVDTEANFYTVAGMQVSGNKLYIGGTYIGELPFNNALSSTGACDAFLTALNTSDLSVVWAQNSGINEGEANKFNEMVIGMGVSEDVASVIVNTIDMGTKEIVVSTLFGYDFEENECVTIPVSFKATAISTGVAGSAINSNIGTESTLRYYADEEFTQGIETIDNSQLTIDNGAVFNLQGQRVNKAQKGVYIQNGRKVVLK
ncbi:MAG: hypothetical protein IKW78_04525 [Prevotella sp.]|nr:hypothetical protein [Prevotella sp.]MBR6015826.1 hypothetical protein [Prevotella sp.]